MKLARLFEKFELCAETSNAAGAMREMVLRLAFSGRLSKTCPKDNGVPSGWENRTIESICSSMTPGFACSKTHQVEGGHVHLRTHNISTLGTLNFDLMVLIDPKMVDPQKSSIRRGDILFNNTNSQELVGKTSLVDRDYEYGFSNHLTRLRLKDEIFPGFVVYYLSFLRNSGHFAKLCTRWINQAAVNTSALKEQLIPLPPLAEQKRIVAKVDELMALCDQLEQQQKERETKHAALARASLDRFTKTPTPANLGFLFHKSYDISPAELRKTILTLAAQGKLIQQSKKEATEITSGGDWKPDKDPPYSLPVNWIWEKLGNLVEFIGGSQPPKSKFIYSPRDGFTRLVQIRDFKSDANLTFIPTALATRLFNNDDVMIGRYGPPVFQILRGLSGSYNVALMKAVPKTKGLSKEFLFYLLQEPRIHDRVVADSDRTAGQSGIRKPLLESFTVGIPPLAEQRRIVAKVDELMALVDQLETQLATSRQAGEKLLEAIVAELTAAELTVAS